MCDLDTHARLQSLDMYDPNTHNPDMYEPDTHHPDMCDQDIHNPDMCDLDTHNPDMYDPNTHNPDMYNLDTHNPDMCEPDICKDIRMMDILDLDTDGMNNRDSINGHGKENTLNHSSNNNDENTTNFDAPTPVTTVFSDFFEIRAYLKLTNIHDGINKEINETPPKCEQEHMRSGNVITDKSLSLSSHRDINDSDGDGKVGDDDGNDDGDDDGNDDGDGKHGDDDIGLSPSKSIHEHEHDIMSRGSNSNDKSPSSSFYKKTNGGDDILGNSIQECDLKSSVDSIKSLSSPYRKSNNNDDSMTISSSSSTWNPDDHAIFTKTFRRVQLNGTLRKAFITTLRSHLPYKSIEDILAYEDWYRRLRSVINSQKDSASTYELSRSELITQAKEGIELLRASLADNMKRNNELHSFEKRRVFQHEKLLELRKIREEQDRIIAERHATVELEIQQKQREEELFIENQRAVQKVKVMGYKNEKELFIESQRKLVEEEKEAIDQEMKKEIESNRLKVQGRRDLLGDKESKKKLKEEEAEVADSRRLEALIRLAQQVPYFGNMQRVKANLAHLTASAKGHEYQPALEEEGRGHLPLNGFTDTKVISDARFRLATALRQAGVQHTDAAKHAVAAMHPRPQLSIHGIL